MKNVGVLYCIREWGVRFNGSEASFFMGVRRPFLWE